MNNNSKESPEKKRRIGDPTGASSSNQPSASSSNQPSAGNAKNTDGFTTPRGRGDKEQSTDAEDEFDKRYEEIQKRHGVGFSKPADQDGEEYYATQPSTTVFAPYVEKSSFKSFMDEFMKNLRGR